MADVGKKLGWDEGKTRRIQLGTGIAGILLLFSGVVCQWWAGNNFSDVSLSTLCNAYSGKPDLMASDDWYQAKQDYAAKYSSSSSSPAVMTLSFVASQFLGFRPDGNYPLNQFLYSSPSFWCKYLPECPVGVQCVGNTVVKAENWTRGAWPGRLVSSDPYWKLSSSVEGYSATRIRCSDKVNVYKAMLTAVTTDINGNFVKDPSTGVTWSKAAVDKAAGALLQQCYESKGSAGYILATGPVLATFASIFCFMTLFRCLGGSYMSSTGQGMAILAVAMTLIDFWVIVYLTNSEFMQGYLLCGKLGPPLVLRGSYFDSTPCMDQNSIGQGEFNPYVSQSAWMTSVYTAGGVCNLIAIVLLLISIHKNKENTKLMKFATLGPSDEL
ncbi:hypothetical protein GUITHDRAFT_161943 [Guillardia theta CCMP2712]|uniref:Uncharacterized protein n=2 Tax=Guillardia theta TaxID=55529 RepID=L1JNH8_GUITC|nr:hypothetical protein GUITHDRAFT_161943 [Guillardia theta CCMP2712]EKX49809.1 hypothetical protein GUITHDRAFT_161943 [Guillardia theta CCMP2712]|eukprot:XP_005836789.1 hypothetical protein GUITHDRAFT_161943 [Guillardia theta CCMP2712]